jgi:hypothetical protein
VIGSFALAEPARTVRPAAALIPLVAGALLGACRGGADQQANAVPPVAPVDTAPNATEVAQRLVRERLGAAQALTFAPVQVFNSQGATIVCGRVAQPGRPEQRYIIVGSEDAFVESQMEPGHMDQAVAEFCRNA